MLQGKCSFPFLCPPQKIACCPLCPSSGSSERWHTMEVMQDHQHSGQDMALVQGPPSLFYPFLQLLWPSECLLAPPRKTAGRSLKATSGLLLRFKGDDSGEQRFSCGHWGMWRESCSVGYRTLGSTLGCAHFQVEPCLGLGQYELCQGPF